MPIPASTSSAAPANPRLRPHLAPAFKPKANGVGVRIMEKVNAALIEATGHCLLNLEQFEAIALLIEAEIEKATGPEPEDQQPELFQATITQTSVMAEDMVQRTPESVERLRLMLCGMAQFRRRPTTPWTEKEMKALRAVFPYSVEDLACLSRWYDNPDQSARTYCRRDIQTLLNNWPGEIDRARQKYGQAQAPKKDYTL